ncbi:MULTISPECIES: LysE family translocator [unclassified Solwaraspora]|uniref:LysE family translocator n=1 Tax=unclassified Solwaraspora TaxID=2627926 RepID=UPI00259BF2E0|nr:LysE family translocator [Solwaraspora sp. WMMA2056]WJK41372.1 LysE family translocator [Solwaraspora sp. WMMA2056]
MPHLLSGELVTFIGVAAAMVVLPGADFTMVVRNALAGRRLGLATAGGVVSGLLLHSSLAALGIAALMIASGTAYRVIQFVGMGYLCYLGIRLLCSRPVTEPSSDQSVHSRNDVRSHRRLKGNGVWRAYRQGLVTDVTNPKVFVFFASLIPQFVPTGVPVGPPTAMLALLIVLLAVIWYPTLAVTVDRAGGLLRQPVAARTLNVLTGLTLLGLSLHLATDLTVLIEGPELPERLGSR